MVNLNILKKSLTELQGVIGYFKFTGWELNTLKKNEICNKTDKTADLNITADKCELFSQQLGNKLYF